MRVLLPSLLFAAPIITSGSAQAHHVGQHPHYHQRAYVHSYRHVDSRPQRHFAQAATRSAARVDHFGRRPDHEHADVHPDRQADFGPQRYFAEAPGRAAATMDHVRQRPHYARAYFHAGRHVYVRPQRDFAQAPIRAAAPADRFRQRRYYEQAYFHSDRRAYVRPQRDFAQAPAYAAATVGVDRGQTASHPAGCPRSQFCGCGVAVKVFGSPVRDLWTSSSWLRFPRATPGPGMVAANHRHVFAILEDRGNGKVLAYDPNSGGGMTRIHEVSLRGYTVVNPRGGGI